MPLNLPTVLAQQTRPRTVTVPETFIVEAEKVAAERDHLRATVSLKDQEIAALRDQVGALNGLAEIQRMRAEAWAKAATERKDAIVIDDKRIGLYEADVLRLRAERDSARRQQKVYGVLGLTFGIVVGVLSQRRSQ